MNNSKSPIVIAVVALIVGVLAIGLHFVKPSVSRSSLVGAVGNQLAEQFDPYIQYNGGYNSALPITTTSTTTTTGFAQNGLTYIVQRTSFAVSSSTILCALLSPASTSTLSFASINATVATSVASSIDIGTSTTATATSSSIVSAYPFAANIPPVFSISPTTNQLVAPSTFVVFGVRSGLSGNGVSDAGVCQAEFYVL